MIKIIIILLITSLVFSQNLDDNPIYAHILRVKPGIDKKYAFKISNLIYKYSKKYKQDPHISVAIARQETSLVNKHRKERIIVFTDKGYEVVEGYTDLCLFQFHINTAINEGLNLLRLNTDLEYCVEQHFRLLKKKRKICEKKGLGNDSWSCYHSYTEKHRKKYIELVERYL